MLAAAAGAAAMAVVSAVGIAGASTAANPPTVQSLPAVTGVAEVGQTLTAANGTWGGSAVSRPSAVVRAAASSPPPGPAGQIKLADGKVSIPVTSVSSPQRLIVSGVQFQPLVVRSRSPFTARFRVTDTRGFVVRGALVYMLGLPYGRIANVPEQETGTDGYVTFQVQPTARLPLVNGGALVVFVRARKPGDNVLAGVSTRRLVQVRLAAP